LIAYERGVEPNMQIIFTVIRKVVVLGLALFLGLLTTFAIFTIIGGPAMMIGFSAAVIAIISFAIIMTVTSLIGDGVFFKTGRWRIWLNLAIIAIPNLLCVYFYILEDGFLLEQPEFKTMGNVILYGSIVFSFLFWGLDELLLKFVKSRRKDKEEQVVV
jgi:hypothetical protein